MIKRRFFLTAACFAALFLCLVPFSCKDEKYNPFSQTYFEYGLSVHFLDVGEGDCAYITLPDGKNMLIDCGSASELNFKKTEKLIEDSGRDFIDYLVVTHTDEDHAGGAAELCRRFGVGKAFIPDVRNASLFPVFSECMSALKECGAETEISRTFGGMTGDGFIFMILYPSDSELSDSAYTDFNAAEMPSSQTVNDISAVIYLEYEGIRFLFTGDAGTRAEEYIADYYKIGLYERYLGRDGALWLENIDFYKAAHHGASDANSSEFLRLLTPKNVVVSSGDNIYGHPSTETLERFYEANPDYSLYRTDTVGTVSVFVGDGGKTFILTEVS